MTNYYILKLYGIPMVPVQSNNKPALDISPLLITSLTNKYDRNLKRLQKANGFSESVARLVEDGTEICTNYDTGNFNVEYKKNQKIHEAHIPYLSAKLVNMGKLPDKVIGFVKYRDLDENDGSDIPNESSNSNKLISYAAIQNLQTLADNATLNDFIDAYYDLCKGEQYDFSQNQNPSPDQCILYAYLPGTEETGSPVKLYACYKFENGSTHTFVRDDRLDIVYSQNWPGNGTYYIKGVQTKNGLSVLGTAPSTADPNGGILGYPLKSITPMRIDKDKEYDFYLWSNLDHSYYLTDTSINGNDIPDIYTFNRNTLQYTKITVDPSKYVYIAPDCFRYNDLYFYYTPRVLEKLGSVGTVTSETKVNKNTKIVITDGEIVTPPDKPEYIIGSHIQLATTVNGTDVCQFEPIALKTPIWTETR